MSEQSRYWHDLVILRRDAIYMSLFAEETENLDRYIEIVKAVAANGAIGAWAIFQIYPLFWAAIVAVAQLVTTVKDYLPYKKRLKSLSGLSVDLHALALVAETDWFNVSNGNFTDLQIHELRMALQRKIFESIKKHFGGINLKAKSRLTSLADSAARAYFEKYAGDEE